MVATSGTGAVVLAAGAGTRFIGPRHKLASPLGDGHTLAATAVRTALRAAVGPVVVVIGPVPADQLGLPPGADVVHNERWAEGQATSLHAAVRWARSSGHGAVVVALADQPGLTTTAWRAVAEARATAVAVATYGGRRGHPVRLSGEIWDDLPHRGDQGARALLRSRPELVTEVPCVGDPGDIDTAEDLAAWLAAHQNAGPLSPHG